MAKRTQRSAYDGLGRELRQSIVLLALTGSSIGGFMAVLNIATRALGR